MKKFFKCFNKIIEYFMIILTILMCFTVIWQVFTRFVLNQPSSWTEEIARYLMIWISFIGSSLAIREGNHISMNFVVNKVESKIKKQYMLTFADIASFGFGFVLFRYGFDLVLNGIGQNLMCAKISMSIVYTIVPFSGFLFLIYYGIDIVNDFKQIVYFKKEAREKKI